jgi:hypothetical protein
VIRLRESGIFLLAVAAGITGGVTVLACCCAGFLQVLAWIQETAGLDSMCVR